MFFFSNQPNNLEGEARGQMLLDILNPFAVLSICQHYTFH